MRPSTLAAALALLPAVVVTACASGELADGQDAGWSDDASPGDSAIDRSTGDDAAGEDSTSSGDSSDEAAATDAASTPPGDGAVAAESSMPDSGGGSEAGLCSVAPNGASCGNDRVCGSGTCNACTQSAACTPSNACHTGQIECSSGMPVCTDTGTSLANGTGCGASSVCESGACDACGAMGQYCCAANVCSGSPDACISAVASTCRTNVSPQCTCGTLSQGMELTAGQSLWSCDGHYQLAMQTDGNFVLYEGSTPLWSSNTAGTGSASYAIMQDDGNLVVYTSTPAAVWSSDTAGNGCGVYLAVQTDGNVVVYTSSGTPLWDTGT